MPPKGKRNTKAQNGPKGMSAPLPPGLIMTDLIKKQWKLGQHFGQGGFGYLYFGTSVNDTAKYSDGDYVIKVEPFLNGPLFVEIAFYQRAAKPDKVQAWLKEKKTSYIGVPKYIASGSFEASGAKYRFMVMERFGSDVDKIFQKQKKFSLKTCCMLALRILDALEYLHAHEYTHADIKASNLLLGDGKKANQVYLLDYGLAYRYAPDGVHVAYKEDPKRKHDGTALYTSVDAHKGVAPSRRGDLEILGFCLLHWLGGTLPWDKRGEDKESICKDKIKFLNGLPKSVAEVTGQSYVELEEYLTRVKTLEYNATPDYKNLKKVFQDGLKRLSVKDDGKSVLFDHVTLSPKKENGTTPKRRATPRAEKTPRKTKIDTPIAVTPSKKVASPKKKQTKSPRRQIQRRNEPGPSKTNKRQPVKIESLLTDDEDDFTPAAGQLNKRATRPSPTRTSARLTTKAGGSRKRALSPLKLDQPRAKREPVARPRRNVPMVDFAQSP